MGLWRRPRHVGYSDPGPKRFRLRELHREGENSNQTVGPPCGAGSRWPLAQAVGTPQHGDEHRAECPVLFDNWTHLNPLTELARFPRDSIIEAVIVDETGNEVADQLLDPIRELETPEEERYALVLKRCDASGALPPVSFHFRSGEPALECRDHYRGFIGPLADRVRSDGSR
jgi:hypothetical protein